MKKKHKSIYLAIMIIILIIIIFAVIYFGYLIITKGNFDNYLNNQKTFSQEETVTINGSGTTQIISREFPIKLVVSGDRNTITIKNNTLVHQIIIEGSDNSVFLSGTKSTNNPEIIDSGVRTKVSYI